MLRNNNINFSIQDIKFNESSSFKHPSLFTVILFVILAVFLSEIPNHIFRNTMYAHTCVEENFCAETSNCCIQT